ncbi:MAG: DUF6151 family protein [Bdellovibrionales bacterium]
MSEVVHLECSCGEVQAELEVVSKTKSFHVECLCCDCQQYAKKLGADDTVLDKYGATELFQTHPCYLKFKKGQDNISCMQIKENGLFRWYTSCCNYPISNTMSSPKVPFVGIPVCFMRFESEEEKNRVLGPVIMRAFGKYSKGEKREGVYDEFPKSFMISFLAFMIRGFFVSRGKSSPFFKDGKPVRVPKPVL